MTVKYTSRAHRDAARGQVCRVAGCGRAVRYVAGQLCPAHYERKRDGVSLRKPVATRRQGSPCRTSFKAAGATRKELERKARDMYLTVPAFAETVITGWASRPEALSAPPRATHAPNLCSMPKCPGIPASAGLCPFHAYRRDHCVPEDGALPAPSSPCEVMGCDLPSFARRLCKAHYQRMRRGGPLRPLVRVREPREDVRVVTCKVTPREREALLKTARRWHIPMSHLLRHLMESQFAGRGLQSHERG